MKKLIFPLLLLFCFSNLSFSFPLNILTPHNNNVKGTFCFPSPVIVNYSNGYQMTIIFEILQNKSDNYYCEVYVEQNGLLTLIHTQYVSYTWGVPPYYLSTSSNWSNDMFK